MVNKEKYINLMEKINKHFKDLDLNILDKNLEDCGILEIIMIFTWLAILI